MTEQLSVLQYFVECSTELNLLNKDRHNALVHLVGPYYANMLQCTVHRTSNSESQYLIQLL